MAQQGSQTELAPIFVIGFNKCATTSLHIFFTESGIASVHWGIGALAKKMMARINVGEDPISDYPATVAFSDMFFIDGSVLLEPYKRFDYLHSWYPDALFILNTRDREDWIASRWAHENVPTRPPLSVRYARLLGIPEKQVPDFWRAEWEVHHALARAYFRDSPNFLEFHIEQDHPDKLRGFLAQRFEQCAETPFGTHNRRSAADRPSPVTRDGGDESPPA